MHLNNTEFYRGVLNELHKTAQTNTPAIKPAAPPPAPTTATNTPAAAKPVTTNAVSSGPYGIGNLPPANTPNVQKPLNFDNTNAMSDNALDASLAWNRSPREMRSNLINIGQNVVAHGDMNNPQAIQSSIKDQFMKQQNLDHWYSPILHPIDSANAANLGKGLSNLKTPEDISQFLQAQSKYDPELAGAVRGAAGAQVRTHNDNAGFGDLFNDATDQTKQNPLADIVGKDEQIGDYAKDQGLSRAGTLVGNFLTDNWKTIAMSVGGVAAFIALLKSMQSDSGDNITNNYYSGGPSQPSGPSFL
jgi:hypothetical protein